MAISTTRRFDSWARHPAGFTFRELEYAVDAVDARPGATVCDPFAGSGAALTFICGRGDPVTGIEAHPLMAELARLKLTRPGAPNELFAAVERVETLATRTRVDVSLGDEPELLRRFLPPERLADLAAWRDAVEGDDGPWQTHLRWLVLGALRDVAGKGWPYPGRDGRTRAAGKTVGELVAARAARMVEDLVAAPRRPDGAVIHADARLREAWRGIPPGSLGASVSSPPYLNQVSYAEATRLELYFLRRVTSWREMTALVSRHLVTSCTQQVTVARARRARETLARCPGTSRELKSLARALLAARQPRARGKPYDRLIWAYFDDLRQVLEHLRRALAPGARAAWVIGDSAPYSVYVDTPRLIGTLAEELGFDVLEDRLLRVRGTMWAGVGSRHSRTLSERLLVLRRPSLGAQTRLPLLG